MERQRALTQAQREGDPASSGAATPEERLRALVAASPMLGPILDRWDRIALPDCWLSGSAVAQTAWNAAFGLPPDHGLADIDLVYFDPADLSVESEGRHARRVGALFADVPVRIDLKKEARVHLWYEARFGSAIAPYRSSEQAIASFPTTAASVAIRPGEAGLTIFAPFGLADLLACTVRPNKAEITRALYEEKVARWRRCWPGLTIVDWRDDDRNP